MEEEYGNEDAETRDGAHDEAKDYGLILRKRKSVPPTLVSDKTIDRNS